MFNPNIMAPGRWKEGTPLIAVASRCSKTIVELLLNRQDIDLNLGNIKTDQAPSRWRQRKFIRR